MLFIRADSFTSKNIEIMKIKYDLSNDDDDYEEISELKNKSKLESFLGGFIRTFSGK